MGTVWVEIKLVPAEVPRGSEKVGNVIYVKVITLDVIFQPRSNDESLGLFMVSRKERYVVYMSGVIGAHKGHIADSSDTA